MEYSSSAERCLFVLLGLLALLFSPSLAAEGDIHFREVSEDWKVDYVHNHGGSGRYYLVETMSGGVVVFDYDRDGDQDLFFVDGGLLPGYEGDAPRSRLFRNEGPGRFEDVTEGSGILVADYGSGAVSGDYDGDGEIDLYVTAFGRNQLFRNLGDGTFGDVTSEAGVGDLLWSSSATFADLDRDGDLDLYNVNYVDMTIENHIECGDLENQTFGYCLPARYAPVSDRYFENLGDGTFEDSTAKAGLVREPGAGLGVIAADLTHDGWPDLYVTNDMRSNALFINRGDGTFEDFTLLSGAGFNHRGSPEAGMGVDFADLDGNGLADIFATNFENESNALYLNMGGGLFLDSRFASGLAKPSFLSLCFGVAFADMDHDGDQDLVTACGSVNDRPEVMNTKSAFEQPQQIYENVGRGKFVLVDSHGMNVVRSSRGLASGDLDLDGDLDFVITNSGDRAEVYENLFGGEGGNWVQVDFEGSGGNLRAVGARAEAIWDGGHDWREVRTASSYQSQSALSLHFGVGSAGSLTSLSLKWPDGRVQRHLDLELNRRYMFLGREKP